MHETGLTKYLIGKRLMTFGVDGVSIFQSTRLGDTKQIVDCWAPHSMGVHCMVHRTNLMVQTLSHLQMGNKIEGLLQTLYNYFSKSLKRNLEYTKLTKLMETNKAKILKNVKTRWIYMLSLAQCVMVEYKISLMKMALDDLIDEKTKANFDLFCDV
jgi:hypothetical protein